MPFSIKMKLLWYGGAVLLFTALVTPPASGVDYDSHSLSRMIGLADRIVYGVVLRVDDETVRVAVRDSLPEPPSDGEVIDVVRYELYDRPGGLARYKVGETFVWLLVWGPDSTIVGSPVRWRISGAEGSGEILATERLVFAREGMIPGVEVIDLELRGRMLHVHVVPRAVFWKAVTDYRRCVVWTPGDSRTPPRANTQCSKDEFNQLASRSALHRSLVLTLPGR